MENTCWNACHFKQKNRKTQFFVWSPLGHNKASLLPQNCSLILLTSSGGGLWLPTRDWKQWPGAQAGGIWAARHKQHLSEGGNPPYTNTNQWGHPCPSQCVYLQVSWNAPHWTEGSSGSHPYRHQQRLVWRLLLCPPLMYGSNVILLSLSCLRTGRVIKLSLHWVICCNTPKFLSVFHINIVTIITNDAESKAWTNTTKKLSLEPF